MTFFYLATSVNLVCRGHRWRSRRIGSMHPAVQSSMCSHSWNRAFCTYGRLLQYGRTWQSKEKIQWLEEERFWISFLNDLECIWSHVAPPWSILNCLAPTRGMFPWSQTARPQRQQNERRRPNFFHTGKCKAFQIIEFQYILYSKYFQQYSNQSLITIIYNQRTTLTE
jgi:hypothetical protein